MNDVIRGIDLIGVFANAILGGIIARELRFDPVGFGVLAIVSGLGGGVIRDTLLQRGTPIAFTDYAYFLTALGGAVLAFAVPLGKQRWNRFFPWVDAFAVGCWAAAGADKTLALGLGWLPAVLLGTVTAVGGGLVRDVVLQRVPAIFGGNTLYATAAVLASALMVVLHRLGHGPIGLVVTTLVGAALVLLARWRGWRLPRSAPTSAGLTSRRSR